jgi:ankyrin repeat protein
MYTVFTIQRDTQFPIRTYDLVSLLSDVSYLCVGVQEGWTALMLAAYMGHYSTCGLLLDRGANLDAVRKVHSTV